MVTYTYRKFAFKTRVASAALMIGMSAPALATESADSATPASDIAEGSEIVVTATKANEIAPVTASLDTTQPQAIVSRSFIEDSLPATTDFFGIALITPSVSNSGGTNGAGLSESKASIRGFQDGEYNITYDGVPFGDTNDPTHHSNTFFPSNTIETLIVDRGPGNASQLGQATFGGSMNLFSRETRADASAEIKGSYGTWNTSLLRAVLQSGSIDSLGGTQVMLSGQYVKTDGARTYSPFEATNVFGKAVIPIGPDVKLTVLGTYNENTYNQPDKDGTTLAQVALYGKNYSLNNDPNSQAYFGYNHTRKTTDFEIVRLEVNLSPAIIFDNRAFTYSYNNQTLSGLDVSGATSNQVTLTSGGSKVSGVPGYTKTNKYRVYGDIAKMHANVGFATLTAGLWYEWSDTYRQLRNYNLLTNQFNYVEKAVTDPVSGVATPRYIKYDQDSSIQHFEQFAEVEFRPLPGLKVTPGIKHVYFKRNIDASVNATTRYAQQIGNSWDATLPFLTVNYAANDKLSFYGQFARGFLAPPIDVLYVPNPAISTVEPQKSTNYQAGLVYHGGNLSIDLDAYYIDFTNKFHQSDDGTYWDNLGGAVYKGIEGQVTYAFDNGLAVFANGSLNYAKTNNAGAAHTQIANAPVATAAAGLLYKKGPLALSLIDKYTGHQFAQEGEPAAFRIPAYHKASFSARYEIGNIRFGIEVSNIFDDQSVTGITKGKPSPAYDKYFYQPGRAVTGDITVKF